MTTIDQPNVNLICLTQWFCHFYYNGCEIWGYEKVDVFNPVEINFLRLIIPVKKATQIFMLYVELGRMPIKLTIYRRMVCYWARLISGKQSKLSTLLYKIMLNDHLTNGTNYNWINTAKTHWIIWEWVMPE